MTTLKRFVIPGVLVLLLVAAAFTMFRSDDTKTLTAHFPRTISIYEGSDVRVLDARDEDIVKLMKDSDVLFRSLVARRDAVHRLLVSTSTLSKSLTALVRDSRKDLKPALAELEKVLGVLNKNEDNLDNSLRLMAPFYRVFASTLGGGPWFDTYIQNLPPVPDLANGGGVG